jgi:hypothetical protein
MHTHTHTHTHTQTQSVGSCDWHQEINYLLVLYSVVLCGFDDGDCDCDGDGDVYGDVYGDGDGDCDDNVYDNGCYDNYYHQRQCRCIMPRAATTPRCTTDNTYHHYRY